MAYNGRWPAVTDVQWVFVPFYQNNVGVTSQRSTVHKWDDGSTTHENCPRGLQCKHGGYIGPNCACTCPLGLTGRECTQVVHSSSGCGGVLTGSSGKFSSPGYPQKYPISTSCTWLIQGRAGSSISLKFTSLDIEEDVNCFYDHLEVKTYGPTLDGPRYCGNTSPGEIRYNGNALVVKFVSDQQYTNYGFEAQYSIH
ncbi:CUBN [Mytilus edulis]|uniref:CUBN n=1 Tax=Mytilus edulis TaxID=6550 RepID=A0A8S3QJJ8_MYTED|nr:CUBN [Mytilus edulis]